MESLKKGKMRCLPQGTIEVAKKMAQSGEKIKVIEVSEGERR